jgi:hypothetical protein
MGDSVAVLSADDAKGKIVVLGPAMDPTGKSLQSLHGFHSLSGPPPSRWQTGTALRCSGFSPSVRGGMKEGSDDPAAARPLAIFVTRAAAEKILGGSVSSLQSAPRASPSAARLPLPRRSRGAGEK